MSTVIQVDRVSKEYRLGQIGGKRLADDVNRWWARLRDKEDPLSKVDAPVVQSRNGNGNGTKHSARRASGFSSQNGSSSDRIWALKDVSLEVKQGEVLGIIGRNGAGKSTLLKILSRVTAPTSGEVRVKGRIASLLEVGTGFHPELTGRENIFLNGAILGMTKAEIKRKFDEIVAFSEVEKFIDTPVKRYSSGMYVRLAFAVAAHLEPEILIVDEVLAVGDVQFQKKCLGKMGEVAREGRTVLFVSHNMEAVRKLCSRGLLMKDGGIAATGDTQVIIEKCIDDDNAGAQSVYEITPPENKDEAPGYAYRLTVEDSDGNAASTIPVGQPWQVRVNFELARRTEHFVIALGLCTNMDTPLRTSWSQPLTLDRGKYQAVFREDKILQASGRYTLVVGLSSYERAFHYSANAGVLEIADYSEGVDLVRVKHTGPILNPLEITICKV